MSRRLAITELALRDAHQSLLATRLRLEDLLPAAALLDKVGFWSIESWGGATFDACIRYLGEDPWVRLRELKRAMPNTPQQMLLRGQNLLGYRHYADDLVWTFVERAALNGIDVFRIFDALNDVRNLQTAIAATLAQGKHAQGTLCYTTSPVHNLQTWLDLARRLEDLGCQSLAIKDMAGLLRPFEAFELVSQLKQAVALPLSLHSHATTGISVATLIKAVEAGVDVIDCAISPLSMTYSHSPTESLIAIFADTPFDTGLDLSLLEPVAEHFRQVRHKYAQFEGSLKGVDARILTAQVPGGMLTNMEAQLKEQRASHRLDEVLAEIPRVRRDLGYPPLVTPTSQIVGTQAVLNVISGQAYKTISKETAGILKGEYGQTPAPVNPELALRVLQGQPPLMQRPADLLAPELDSLQQELAQLSAERNIRLADEPLEDVLTYAQFQLVALKFLENRGQQNLFEAVPAKAEPVKAASIAGSSQLLREQRKETYSVQVNQQAYMVEVAEGDIIGIHPLQASVSAAEKLLPSPLAGMVLAIKVAPGDWIAAGAVVVVLESMKVETEIRSPLAGRVAELRVKVGDSLLVGEPLLALV